MAQRPRRVLRRLASKGRRLISGVRKEPSGGIPLVVFLGKGQAEVEPGTTVLEAARSMGIDLDHFCGGCRSCGTCRVEVRAGSGALSRPQADESLVLGPNSLDAGDRLACQARVHGKVEVSIPPYFGVRED